LGYVKFNNIKQQKQTKQKHMTQYDTTNSRRQIKKTDYITSNAIMTLLLSTLYLWFYGIIFKCIQKLK